MDLPPHSASDNRIESVSTNDDREISPRTFIVVLGALTHLVSVGKNNELSLYTTASSWTMLAYNDSDHSYRRPINIMREGGVITD